MAEIFIQPGFKQRHGMCAAHAFFGRRGGVSKGVYASLNCGPGSDDAPEAVTANRKIVAETVGADHVLSLYQVHGNKCLDVKAPWRHDERPQADAYVTDVKGLALGVLTADCAPVLFYGETEAGKPVVGAAHAGWKGALGGVLEATVTALKKKGAVEGRISACIGPCINKRSYEVGGDFYARFIQDDPENDRFFGAAGKQDHFLFDLAGFCAGRLAGCGVKLVFIRDIDTYFNEEDFFSYRRTMHRQDKDYGRQISVIVIR